MEERYLDPEIERLTEIYEKDPTARVFAPLADAYRKSKLYDEAIDILKKGLEIHPGYVSAHLVLARCYYDKDMLQLAKGSLEKVLELDQQNVIALKLLGDILYRLGDEAAAFARYKNVLDIDPTNLEVQALMEKITPPATEPPVATKTEPQNAVPQSRLDAQQFDSLVPETPPRIDETRNESWKLAEEPSTPLKSGDASSDSEQAGEDAEEGFATATLAEIYEEQGFLEKALDVYRQLAKSNPDDQQIATKVAELTAKTKPQPKEEIRKTEETFSGLLGREQAEKKSEDTEEEKKGDFSAFKQWLEGLSKNDKVG